MHNSIAASIPPLTYAAKDCSIDGVYT